MIRKLGVTVACTLAAAAGLALGTAGPAAHAATDTKTPIRTYTEYSALSFKGVGSDKGYLSLTTDSERVALSPHLAYTASGLDESTGKGSQKTPFSEVLVGDHFYTKTGGGSWKVQTLSAAVLAANAQGFNPYTTQQKFDALHGVHQVSRTESTVTGTLAQLNSFMSWEYGESAAAFKGSGIKTLTADFWVDSSGRPVKITVVGKSSTNDFTTVETFGNYNKPQTFTAP